MFLKYYPAKILTARLFSSKQVAEEAELEFKSLYSFQLLREKCDNILAVSNTDLQQYVRHAWLSAPTEVRSEASQARRFDAFCMGLQFAKHEIFFCYGHPSVIAGFGFCPLQDFIAMVVTPSLSVNVKSVPAALHDVIGGSRHASALVLQQSSTLLH